MTFRNDLIDRAEKYRQHFRKSLENQGGLMVHLAQLAMMQIKIH